MSYLRNKVTIFVITLTVFIAPCNARPTNFHSDYNNKIIEYTREITLKKQGKLVGMIVELKNRDLPAVEIFRGIPYAAPPVGDFRFMPTRSATTWSEVRIADSFGPVCPQTFPNETEMSNQTREYFRRLKPYLENESEDCLYLNIYAPHQPVGSYPRKYPVMVYIHGESFEWNSGNPYDGSVLAAYGQVMVVTLNFRLGILGFLNVDVEENSSQSNFGLVDLMAALVWIKENIEAFSGDPENITLFGHGTGAVCASLFTISPLAVQNNIKHFHRAILMSGTALADWALATHHRDITYQVAKALNCPIGNKFADCLRKKRLEDIRNIPLVTDPYKPRFGPVVDSRLVPNDPKKSMTQYTDIFKRFELMYGVTEQESIHLPFGEVALRAGMLEKERNDELMKYMRSRCEFRPEICLVETLSRYNYANELKFQADQEFRDYTGHEPDKASLARDELLDILSDARTVAPVVQTGLHHCDRNMQSYFYVFTHKTQSVEHIRNKSYNGEELPYVFGVPLDGPKLHFLDAYTNKEKLLSEIIMTYFTNFAYNGNPMIPRKNSFLTAGSKGLFWFQEWTEFDPENQNYMIFDTPPQRGQYYRKSEMNYWLKEFSQKNPLPWVKFNPPTEEPFNNNRFENFSKPYRVLYPTGVLRTTGERINPRYDDIYGTLIREPPIGPPPTETVRQSTSTMNILLIIGGVFLLANFLFFMIMYFKCLRNKSFKSSPIRTASDEIIQEDKQEETGDVFMTNGCNIVKMISKSSKSDETYDIVKPDQRNQPKNKLTRQLSNSTIDAHTKVRDWITNEIVYKYSPRYFRRNRQGNNANGKKDNMFSSPGEIDNNSTLGRCPTRPVSPTDNAAVARPLLIKTASIDSSKHRRKPEKISVGIDATPAGRGPSVLMQQPVELTKSFDCQRFTPTPLRRSITLEDFSPRKINANLELRRSTTSIKFTPPETEPTVIKIDHSHSKSDPVQDLNYSSIRKMRTFDPNCDVNVTSRDEKVQIPALTPEEALMTIKRRNFPKVLPDHPGRDALIKNRRSMPVHNLFHPIPESSQITPPYSTLRFPPLPPPRTSTLTRQPNSVQPVCLSEPMLAEEPPASPEPEVTCNNLYVGPLIPRNSRDKLNTQPVYDSLRSLKSEAVVKNDSKFPKTIISANSNDPPKRGDPKVVVKPTITRTKSDDKTSKSNIPRVVVPDNQPYVVPNIKTDLVQKPDNCTEGLTNSEESAKGLKVKKSQIPLLIKTSNSSLNKECASLESSPSSTPSEESDTGTVVKKV